MDVEQLSYDRDLLDVARYLCLVNQKEWITFLRFEILLKIEITLKPEVVSFWLESFDERFHTNFDHIWAASALSGSFAVLDPARWGEICRLGAIESVIKSSVITVREGNHKFTGFLDDLVVRNRMILQHRGRNNRHFVSIQIEMKLLLETVGKDETL